MDYRRLGKTGLNISEISLGTWQVGGRWGEAFSHENADSILNNAVDKGINFIDTADVYSDGESEKAVGRLVRSRSERIYVATKCGRQLNPHISEAYQPSVVRKFVEDSLKNMQLECIDLIQLHCPPTDVFYRPEIFAEFEKLKAEGKIANLGVSVEKVEEALKAIEYDNVTTIQIIFNMFRQRPAELFFEQAYKKDIGIIVRVPLASGLLTGKFSANTTFAEGDHRQFNRNGEHFDKGETFSGIPYNKGLEAVNELKHIFPEKDDLANAALKWILTYDMVSCVIPGASNTSQLTSNINTSLRQPLTRTEMQGVTDIYNKHIKADVHQRW